MRASIVVGALAMALAVVGCQSSELGADDWDQFISQLCEEFESCCTAAGRPKDGAKCRASHSELGPAGFDQAKGNACLQEVRALGADKCTWISPATPTCEQVFAGDGTAKPGEACQNSSDCAVSAEGQVRCVQAVVDDVFVQQCQLVLRGVESSSPCVGTLRGGRTSFFGDVDTPPTEGYLCDFADGLTCDRSSDACEALAALGESCNLGGSADCVPSAYCDFNEDVCKDRLAPGASCWNDDWCQPTAYCQDRTCAARQPDGTRCATDAECLANTCTNQTCQPTNEFALVFLCGSL